METSVGQLLVNEALPEELRDYSRKLDKKSLKDLMSKIAKEYPDRYRQISFELMQVGRRVARESGGFSFHLDHLQTAKAAKATRSRIQKQIKALRSQDLTPKQRREAVIRIVGGEMSRQREEIFKEALANKNPLAYQVLSGSRGNESNLAALIGSDLLYTDQNNNPIPIPILHSYSEGLAPDEYFASAYGARKGVLATKGATADSGFLAKQLNQLTHRLLVTDEDDAEPPKYPLGLPVDTDDMDSEGALLSQPVGGYERDTVLTPKILRDLRRRGHNKILVRSPIASQNRLGGVFAKDVGVRESGRLPSRGSFVGKTAAQALSERLSQSTLGAKHGGGVAGNDKSLSGFAYINQLLQVPKTFKEGATHTQLDGVVTAIKPSDAGGYNVFVGNQRHYVPADLSVQVKVGDTVEAGDVLTDGIPNPREIVTHKGIGEGRRYFVNALRKGMRASGLPAARRNVELVARGLIDHVKLKAEHGDYVPDDVIPYHVLARSYKPRPGFITTSPKSATGKYLETPVLHHTIGTRITPSIAAELAEFGVSDIDVHEDEPIFEPKMVRAMGLLQYDEDWLTNQYGSNLKRSLQRNVTRGATSDVNSVSFVPALAKSTTFGRTGVFADAPKPDASKAHAENINRPSNIFDLNKPIDQVKTAIYGDNGSAEVPGSSKFKLEVAPKSKPKLQEPPTVPDTGKQIEQYWNYPKPSPELDKYLGNTGNNWRMSVHSGYAPRLRDGAPEPIAQEYQQYRQQWGDWRNQQQQLEQQWAASPETQSTYFDAWEASPFAAKPDADAVANFVGGYDDLRDIRQQRLEQFQREGGSRYSPQFSQAFGDLDRDLVQAAGAGQIDGSGAYTLMQSDPDFDQFVVANSQDPSLRDLTPEQHLSRLAGMAEQFYGPRVSAFNRLETTFNQFGDHLYGNGWTEWSNRIPGLQAYLDASNTGLRADSPDVAGRWIRQGQLTAEDDLFARIGGIAGSQQNAVQREFDTQQQQDDSVLGHLAGVNSYQRDMDTARVDFERQGYTPEQAILLARQNKDNLAAENDPTVASHLGSTVGTLSDLGHSAGNLFLLPAAAASTEDDAVAKALKGTQNFWSRPMERLLGRTQNDFDESYTESIARRAAEFGDAQRNPQQVLEQVQGYRDTLAFRQENPAEYQRLLDLASAGNQRAIDAIATAERANRYDTNGYLDKLQADAEAAMGQGWLARTAKGSAAAGFGAVPEVVGYGGLARVGGGLSQAFGGAAAPTTTAVVSQASPASVAGKVGNAAKTGLRKFKDYVTKPISTAEIASGVPITAGLSAYLAPAQATSPAGPGVSPAAAVSPGVESQPKPGPSAVREAIPAVTAASTSQPKQPVAKPAKPGGANVNPGLILALLAMMGGRGGAGGVGNQQGGGSFNLMSLLPLLPVLSKLDPEDFKTLTRGSK